MINITDKHIIVIGDVMLDRYWRGDTKRISPEAPVPVVHIQETEARPGGAANVALNIASLGARVSLFGLVGEDRPGNELIAALQQHKINLQLLALSGLNTITKLRIFSRHQQLIRLDQENDFSVAASCEWLEKILPALDQADLIILSDYNKGTLASICADIIQHCQQLSIPVVIDPKGNDWHQYRNATLLTPNLSEFQQMVGDCDSEKTIAARGHELIADLGLDALLITRSEKGMTLIDADRVIQIPACARKIFDVSGAGDTVIAVFSAAYASGENFYAAARLANQAAGIVVGKPGVASVTRDDLAKHAVPSVFDRKIFNEQDLLIELKAKHSGKRIVMTNGCYDILHSGHVDNLQRCKALGDILIVAVNDDASVRQLKGKQRPVIPLQQRLQVLAGLSSVDYLIAFNEQTPERLIHEILPNVLVKGGDYHADQVVGAKAVLAAGGQVEIIDLFTDPLHPCSSTEIIQRIRNLPDTSSKL